MPNLQYWRPRGRPRLTLTEDRRLRVTRFFEARADSIEPAVLEARAFDAWLTPDAKYTDCILVDQFTSPAADQTVEVTLTQVYEQITATATRVGSISSRAASSRAFVGTDANGKVISSTRFAREWSANYVLTGDASASDGAWLAVNAPLAFGSRTGYLTGTSTIARANGYSLVARTYNEVPDRLVYNTTQPYTFQGKVGYSSRMGPYVTDPSTTRETTVEIEETYHVGEVAALALEFEVYRRASGVVDYTRATGEQGAKAFSLDGIGRVTVSISNKVFAGYLCSSVAGTVESSHFVSGGGQAFPDYPVGKKRISSKTFPWRGDIWVRRNAYVTFP